MSGKVGWPLGKPRSEESRKKMSEQMRRRWTDPEYRGRLAIAHGARAQRPPRGTPERRYYEKVRNILGSGAAEEALRAMQSL
jgi:hypothetical protein